MGDFNAKIGQPKKEESTVTGPFGYGKRNCRGARLLQYAHETKQMIINTRFRKNDKSKWTWISPDKKYKNEIDFMLTNNPRMFTNFEVLNLPFPSDHTLIRGSLNLIKKKKSRKSFSSPQNQLKTEDDRNRFIANLKQSLLHLDIKENDNVLSYYTKLEETIKKCLSKPPEQGSRHKRSIISNKAKELMARRSLLQHSSNLSPAEKEELKALYKATNKEIKRNYKEHRHNTMLSHLKTSGSLKKAMKELNNVKQWIPSLNSKSTKTQTRLEVINTATKFYQDLFTAPDDPGFTNDLSRSCPNLNISEHSSFHESDILRKINRLKSDKSSGTDGISNEAIKSARTILLVPITHLFNMVLDEEVVPPAWTESEIILLYKKGDPTDVGNYRPISLMPCMYKLFASCLLEKLSDDIENHQPIEQAGFRKGFSTIDHIQVLEQTIEKYTEFRRPLYIAFVDYKKAFDSISHNSIWSALNNQNINGKYINILKNVYAKSTSTIKLERSGKRIRIGRGVRQGDPLSPKLFIAVLQSIMSDLPWTNRGLIINDKRLTHLRFADDIVIFSEEAAELQAMLIELHVASKKIGLEMNLSKTKLMSNHTKIPITLNNSPVDYVNDYIYLGKLVSFSKNNNIEEIDRRIATTWKKYWSYKEIMKSNIHIQWKKKIMDTCLLPCLTYGCQTWIFDSVAKRKLNSCQRALERSALKIRLLDRIKHSTIRKKTKVIDAVSFAQSLKWKWAGHVARFTDGRWTQAVTAWRGPTGYRRRGRPKARWKDELETIAGKNWNFTAANRDEWKALEEAFTHRGVHAT